MLPYKNKHAEPLAYYKGCDMCFEICHKKVFMCKAAP